MEDIHYLYKITNLVNGKLYIGVTKNPKHRQLSHFSEGERLVNKACEKYGKDNLTFEIICEGSKDYIYDLEIKAIKLYNSDATTGHGYNICSGGVHGNAGNVGREHLTRVDDTPYYVSGFWFPNRRTALKSLGWGEGMFSFRNKTGTLGETIIPAKRQGPQEPVYVSGFWFPSKKLAIASIGITPNVYEKRRKEGSLGQVCYLPKRKSNSTALKVPNYYLGFWFPDLITASAVFGKSPETIRKQILRGVFEEDNKIKQERPRRNYMAEGLEFETLDEASLVLSIPATTIKSRISKGVQNYGYIYSTKG